MPTPQRRQRLLQLDRPRVAAAEVDEIMNASIDRVTFVPAAKYLPIARIITCKCVAKARRILRVEKSRTSKSPAFFLRLQSIVMKLELIAVGEVHAPETWFELVATVRAAEYGRWGFFVVLWPQLSFLIEPIAYGHAAQIFAAILDKTNTAKSRI